MPDAQEPGFYISTAWIGDGGRRRTLDCNLARHRGRGKTRAEAMEIARACPLPTLCWMFADSQGHIGRQANGWFPDRPKDVSGLLPIAAWDQRNHWRGRLPADVLPATLRSAGRICRGGQRGHANGRRSALGDDDRARLSASAHR